MDDVGFFKTEKKVKLSLKKENCKYLDYVETKDSTIKLNDYFKILRIKAGESFVIPVPANHPSSTMIVAGKNVK